MSRDRQKPIVTALMLLAATVLAFLPGCRATGTPAFDGQRAYAHVKGQCDLGPRPAGSAGARATARYISDELQRLGWRPSYQDFTYRGVALQNVTARRGETGPAIIIGAHYDTRPKADRDPLHPNDPVPGASDGASGVAVLLELARVLGTPRQTVILAFFDAEDQGDLGGWDWAVGATYMAATLQEPVAKMVLVDMVGDADQQLYWEVNSDSVLRKQLWDIAASLGYGKEFIPQQKHNLIDDHVPFLRRGIPAVDIIDFDYPYWHTTQDTPDKVSPQSLERVGHVLETWLKQ
ncbi:MAG: M28 family peptidase [Chloroflexota bacterium]|nr:M28 family peptidase [Chloroflexota bacterium]